MKAPPLPADEAGRLEALHGLEALDTASDPLFDDLVELASSLCGTPMAMVSLVDADRQWFKARKGVPAQETPREVSFCGHAIAGVELFEVADASTDDRFSDSPLVTGELGVRFYAGVPLVTQDNYAVGTLCVMDRHGRMLSDQQRKSLEALARQVTALLEARRNLQRVEELSREKAEFLRIASHDLKNPVQAILGAAECISSGLEDAEPNLEDIRTFSSIIAEQSSELAGIVADFVDGSSIEDGQLLLSKSAFNVNDLVQHVARGQSPIAARKSAQILVDLPAAPLPVSADRARLSQVLKNFVSNAVKFGPKGGSITMTARVQGDFVRLSVRDEGPGIADADRAVLFTMYGRASAKPTAGELSTGVGLAICRQFIEAHGGAIGADNHPDGGAEFWCTIPSSAAETPPR